MKNLKLSKPKPTITSKIKTFLSQLRNLSKV